MKISGFVRRITRKGRVKYPNGLTDEFYGFEKVEKAYCFLCIHIKT